MMTKTELKKSLVGVVSVSLSFALGITLYQAFLVADMSDLEDKKLVSKPQKSAPKPSKPKPMKDFSGHGKAVSDNKDDSQRQSQNREMVQSASSSQMLGK
jgi:hypothetical protein